MTRIGAFIYGIASLALTAFLIWNGLYPLFDGLTEYLAFDRVTRDLKIGGIAVFCSLLSLWAAEGFLTFAFTRPKIEIILPNGDRI